MEIKKDVKYVGVNDRKIDLFEGQYSVPNGMAYNSYVIIDEKIAVMDSVDKNFGDEWIENIKSAINGRTPDFLVVQHMEPDHSANIVWFTKEFPNAQVVSSDKSFVMMKQFFGTDFSDKRTVVKEGDVLSLGKHKLSFISAPMVHWPEVMLTYDEYDKTLYSADAFGKFGALDTDEDWTCEARRYYFGIVGKYGIQVQKLLEKAKKLDITAICPLHGPVLTENLDYYLNLYGLWSSYGVESDGVFIAYTSVYGHTKKAVELLVRKLNEEGCPKVTVTDLAREDMAEAVEDAFRYGKIILATTTYNGDIFPFMREFISELSERGYKNRKIGVIENGSWAPVAARKIKQAFENSVNIVFAENVVTLRSALNEENEVQIEKLAKEMAR